MTTTSDSETGTGRWQVRIERGPCIMGGDQRPVADAGQTRFVVKSPRGRQVFRHRDQRAAITIAAALANIDELLARVHRLERNAFGTHPALRAAMTNRLDRALQVVQDRHA